MPASRRPVFRSELNWSVLMESMTPEEGVRAWSQEGSLDRFLTPTTAHSALHQAVLKERVDWIVTLLEHGANPNVETVDGVTPLLAALESPRQQAGPLVDVLLSGGADPTIVGWSGWTRWAQENFSGSVSMSSMTPARRSVLQKVVEGVPLSWDDTTIFGEQHIDAQELSEADQAKLIGVFTHLIRSATQWRLVRLQALLLAVKADDLVSVQKLLDAGSDVHQPCWVNLRQGWRQTRALHLVKSWEMATCLINAGARLDVQDANGRCPDEDQNDPEIKAIMQRWILQKMHDQRHPFDVNDGPPKDRPRL